MRVIAGSARGRKLRAPQSGQTRPITDRAKEGIFNMLESLGGVVDESIVDLYAGSGSFGIESLSRGASHVTFVEQDREAQAVLAKNLETLGFADRATIVSRPVENVLKTLSPVGIAFCDPPYADDPWSGILGVVKCQLLVGHAERPIALPESWEELKRRKYGRSRIVIAQPLESPT